MGEDHVPKTKDARGEEGPEGEEPENYKPRVKTRTALGSLMTVLKHSDWKDMVLMGLGTLGSVADGLSMASIMIVLSNLMNGYASSSLGLEDINKVPIKTWTSAIFDLKWLYQLHGTTNDLVFVIQYAMDLLYVAIGVGSGAFLGNSVHSIFPPISSKMHMTWNENQTYPSPYISRCPSLSVNSIRCLSSAEGFCWARTAERQCFRLRRRYLEAVLRQDVGFFERSDGKSMTSQVVSSISVDTITIQGVLTEKVPKYFSLSQ